MARRPITVLSLSFLDVMSCGFGAVVLFFVIINASSSQPPDYSLAARETDPARLRAELMRAEKELARRVFELDAARRKVDAGAAENDRLLAALDDRQERIALLHAETVARERNVAELQASVKSLEEEKSRLSAESVTPERAGNRLRRFDGDGERQYLTGLRVGGERILILVDRSASMLDETIVNILRRRNMEPARQKQAPKWKRVLATVDWLTAQIPPDSQFQLYSFNTSASPSLESSEGKWLDAANGENLQRAARELHAMVPVGGTSLHAAFEAIGRMSPLPDNVYLLVDGLPTQGASKPRKATVTARQRLKHFESATRLLVKGVPLNIILFPMEGDPLAAGAFWRLAQVTEGSFMAPSRDWP